MKRSHLLLAALAVTALLAVAAMAVAWRDDRVMDETIRRVGARPLGPTEAELLARCQAIDLVTLLKIVEQDLDVPCPAGRVPDALAHGARPRWTGWLVRVSEDARRPARTRLRAALAAWQVTGAPGRAPALLALLPDDAERARLVEAWAAAGEAPAWAPPSARAAVERAAWRDGDLGHSAAIVDGLYLEAELGLDDRDARAARVDEALTPLGYGGTWLAEMRERQGRRLPIADLPRPVLRMLDTRLAACDAPSSADCLRLAADLVEASVRDDADSRGPSEPEPPPRAALSVLWEVAYEPGAREAAARRVAATSAWITEAPDRAARVRRLLTMIARPPAIASPAGAPAPVWRDLPVGDPLLVLEQGRGTPWATGALAQSLGRDAGIAVRVEALGDGVIVDVDGHRVGVGPCGAELPVPPAVAEAWPRDAVLAQAAIEMSGAAMRRADGVRALRLATLAESLDPVSAAGVTAILHDRVAGEVIGADTSRAAGAAAGALVPIASDPGAAALTDRRARGGAWDHSRVEWNEAGRPACPSALGP